MLKVDGDPTKNIPANVYKTPEELLLALGGYTQVEDNLWRHTEEIEYMQVTIDGATHYLPKSIALFDGDTLVPEDMDENIIPVKYYEAFEEKTGCADISGDPEKYYKIYQDNYNGTSSTNNPVFVDELGNVQYRHRKNADGSEIATNDDGSIAYETIPKTIDPGTDPALVKRAIDDAVNELIANYPEEAENLETTADKIAFLKGKDEATYNDKVAEYFERDFPYLLDGTVKFFNKDDFNLASSLFDNFQLVKMTQYSYLNEHDNDRRSINNLFMIEDAERSD